MFILFFGTRTVVRDDPRPAAPPQECPRCQRYVVMKPRLARPFFHVFWLPLFPVGAGEPIVECPNCGARFAA